MTRDLGSVAPRAQTEESGLVVVGPFQPQLFIKLVELELPTRACTYFDKVGFRFVGDLVRVSRSDLIDQPNLGRKTVREIESTLQELGLALGMTLLNWELLDHELAAKKYRAQSRAPRMRSADVRPRLVQLSMILAEEPVACDVPPTSVEEELDFSLARALKERARAIVSRKVGWSEEQAPTLQSVATQFELSRERIRQVVDGAKRRIDRLEVAAPLTKRCLGRVADLNPANASAIEKALVDEGFIRAGTRLRAVLTAAELLGLEYNFVLERTDSSAYVFSEETRPFLKDLKNEARRATEAWGCTTVDDVVAAANASMCSTVSAEVARGIIESLEGFAWLDEETGYFWIRGVRNRLLNNLDKVLALGSQVDVSELRAAVRRHHRMHNTAPPRRVLLEICHQLDGCEVEGTVITDRGARDPAQFLSESERALRRLLLEHGPLLGIQDFERHALASGMNIATFQSNISNSPIIRRFAKGVYGLVGTRVSPGEISAAQPSFHRKSVRRDWGYTSGGDVWVEYQLSSASITSGVFSVPAKVEELVAGDFVVDNDAGVQIATLRVKNVVAWGFLPYFSRNEPEPEDLMRVTFHLAEHRASIELMDDTDEVLERISQSPPRSSGVEDDSDRS